MRRPAAPLWLALATAGCRPAGAPGAASPSPAHDRLPPPETGGWTDPGPPPEGGPCPSDMAYVPGGTFTSGATRAQVQAAEEWPDPWVDPRPRAVRRTEAYCIDLHEYPNVPGVRPEAWVGWANAREACALRGRRLCTEDEWTRACGGDDGWLYPYGDTHRPGTCNDGVTPIGAHDRVAPAGSFPGCASPYKVLDMDGNVSEWVDAPHETDPDRLRVVRGGTMWVAIYGTGCMSRHAHVAGGPTHGDDGFRCCRDPLPETPAGVR